MQACKSCSVLETLESLLLKSRARRHSMLCQESVSQ